MSFEILNSLLKWKRFHLNYISVIDKYITPTGMPFIYVTTQTQNFLTGIGVIIFLISYFVGTNIQLDQSSAQRLKEAFLHKINGLNYIGIFTNNLIITIVMFLPGIESLFGVFSGYSTGTIFSAITHDSASHTYISPLVILLIPFGIMEVFCYGLAISRSFILLSP